MPLRAARHLVSKSSDEERLRELAHWRLRARGIGAHAPAHRWRV